MNLFQNDTSHVNISVENVNEWGPRFRYSQYTLHAHSAREGSIVGKSSIKYQLLISIFQYAKSEFLK